MDVQPEVIRSQLADSLARLGTDYVDLYYQVRLAATATAATATATATAATATTTATTAAAVLSG